MHIRVRCLVLVGVFLSTTSIAAENSILEPGQAPVLLQEHGAGDQTTNCAFGGDDLKNLFVTAGGSLWSIHLTTRGQSVWLK